jgi:hypothetical protein
VSHVAFGGQDLSPRLEERDPETLWRSEILFQEKAKREGWQFSSPLETPMPYLGKSNTVRLLHVCLKKANPKRCWQRQYCTQINTPNHKAKPYRLHPAGGRPMRFFKTHTDLFFLFQLQPTSARLGGDLTQTPLCT